jgi:hypothetical protein
MTSPIPTRVAKVDVNKADDANKLQAQITEILSGDQAWSAVTTGTPPSGKFFLYFKSDGKLYKKNDAGTEAEIG